jgi:hypothetical protein
VTVRPATGVCEQLIHRKLAAASSAYFGFRSRPKHSADLEWSRSEATGTGVVGRAPRGL